MPPDLRHAHQALDKAVDDAYGKKTFTSDAERVAFLFELYHKYTSLLPGRRSLPNKETPVFQHESSSKKWNWRVK